MRNSAFILLFAIFSCGQSDEKKEAFALLDAQTDTRAHEAKSDLAARPDPAIKEEPAVHTSPVQPLPSTQSIYRMTVPGEKNAFWYVKFAKDQSFALQQWKNDSLQSITGQWSPSNGMIWLYKDQVVHSRFVFKKSLLHYFDPVTKQTVPLQEMPTGMDQAAWQQKKQAGSLFYGIGTEPFWSVEWIKQDTVLFRLADKPEPFYIPVQAKSRDSLFLVNDSLSFQMRITNRPCSDGMSELYYAQQVEVRFKEQHYKGCGAILTKARQ